jgi:hypothetical protein
LKRDSRGSTRKNNNAFSINNMLSIFEKRQAKKSIKLVKILKLENLLIFEQLIN